MADTKVIRDGQVERVLVGAFCVIVKTDCETDGSFHSTNEDGYSYGEKRRCVLRCRASRSEAVRYSEVCIIADESS